jgi:hypothetical protein
MSDRRGGAHDTGRNEHRVGLTTLVGSAGAGLVAFGAVAVTIPAVVSATPLSTAWPVALVAGASTAAVVCTARAVAAGVARRQTATAAGAAAATVALLVPGVALGLPLSAEASVALLGGLTEADAVALSAALAVPAFGLGAGVGLALSTLQR